MTKQYFIKSYCTIQAGKIVLDGNSILESDANFTEFSKLAYQQIGISYPKFYKMDNLSKLAIIASELVLKRSINADTDNDIALVFANKSSSLDTDVKYQKSISDPENYYPSPAVFVYTLANICIGEISIKNRLKSENCFFIFDEFDAEFMFAYANSLLETGKAERVLCAWIELFDDEYHTFMYLVGEDGNTEHTIKNLEILYNK